MRIDKIEISNFRGFYERKRNFTFDPAMNVVVGNNTSGKTALLHAVQIALGAFFPGFDLLPKANQQYRRSFSKEDVSRPYNPATLDYDRAPENPSITSYGLITDYIESLDGDPIPDERKISWVRKLKKSTIDRGDLMPIAENLNRMRRLRDKNSRVVLPLLLAFGVNSMGNDYKKVGKTSSQESAIEKAYKNALIEEKTDFSGAFDWIYSYDDNLERKTVHEGNDIAFYNAIKEAIPAIDKISIDIKRVQFKARYTVTGMSTDYRSYEEMSAGFQSTIALVSEIAYRCILLNKFLGEEAVHRTPGVVLIDEVDQYLHPRWQRHILHDLQKAFPKIQFIVTTHSPFIIQSVQNKNLIILDPLSKTIDPENMGIEDIAEVLMGMKTRLRSEKYQKKYQLATEYLNLVNQGNSCPDQIAEVRQQLNDLELKKEMIEDPAFAAYLQFKRGNI